MTADAGVAVRTAGATRIREAQPEDMEAVVAMAQHFLAETVYGGRTSTTPASIRQAATLLMRQGVVLVALAEDGSRCGMLAGLAYDHYLANTRMATESVWWVEPHARGGTVARDLLGAFEDWARAQGATVVELGSWHSRLDRYYARLGYAPAERIFRKEL